jgi:hypothetical protein
MLFNLISDDHIRVVDEQGAGDVEAGSTFASEQELQKLAMEWPMNACSSLRIEIRPMLKLQSWTFRLGGPSIYVARLNKHRALYPLFGDAR